MTHCRIKCATTRAHASAPAGFCKRRQPSERYGPSPSGDSTLSELQPRAYAPRNTTTTAVCASSDSHVTCDAAANARAADLCLELNEVGRAREYAESACELAPDDVGSHVLLARSLRRGGQAEAAVDALGRAR